MKALTAILILLAGVAAAGFAGCSTPLPSAVNVREGRGYCPLCHEWHDDLEMRFMVSHGGKNYRFCDPNCAAAFEKSPDKYLKDPKFNPPQP